ncbi:eCIS core domain-containing protein [Sphingorhabdus sp. Alg231-15]|uniref:eCIS core domain-containing protein n=1 Tax=Sphingorhabdus sp. Alg231-15 TaxID=1922222 RepID=UPI00307C556E
MNDKKDPNKLNEQELDQVTGGAAGKQLLGHELTHVGQQGSRKYIGETEKNLTSGTDRKRFGKQPAQIVAQSGNGEI